MPSHYDSTGARKIASTTFSGRHLLLTVLSRLYFRSFKPQSMSIEH